MTTFCLIFLFASVAIASTVVCALWLRKSRGNPFPRRKADHGKERDLLRETLKGMQ